MPEADLRLTLLGGFQVTLGDRPLAAFAYDKMRALLAYLALEPREHSREALAELLWEDSPNGRGNLRRTLADLRRALEAAGATDPFIGGKHQLGLDPALWVDARQFSAPLRDCRCQRCEACLTQLDAQARLYRGELLTGLELAGGADFSDWLQLKRESLRCHALALLEHLSAAHEQAGRLQTALPFARRLVDLEPWQESAQRQLIGLLARLGQRSAALAQYESCRTQLWKELGVHPEAPTQALAAAARDGQLAPVAANAAPLNHLGPPPEERRSVSVMHVELLHGCEDPEEALEHLHGPQAACIALLQAHGAVVFPAHGGGLLGYFGYPQADEHALRQAASAALALPAAATPLKLRGGLHYGPMLVAAGQPLPDIAGHTTARAVALRQAAAPGEILLSQTSAQLLRGWFHCEPRTDASARLLGSTGASHRLAASPQLSPFCGREDELVSLLELWEAARSGQGQALLLRAEPGIGKSRLLLELQHRSGVTGNELRCLAAQAGVPFFPLQAHAGQDPALARWLDADHPEQRPQRIAGLRDWLLGANLPRLVIVEDAHWADASTLELLEGLLIGLGQRRLLLIISARPEFNPQWRLPVLELTHLPDTAARELLRRQPQTLGEAQANSLLRLADGVPLFIEELSRWCAEVTDQAVPATLNDLLLARLDQLGGARRIAQLAACLGREVDRELLEALLTEREQLPTLIASGLLHDEQGQLRFKHALIQEVAYGMQTRARRRANHGRIAELMQTRFATRYRPQPALLAQHLEGAGQLAEAIGQWQRAAEQARALSAQAEEAQLYRRALALVVQLPASAERDSLELPLQIALGTALNGTAGYGAAETLQAFARARALCHDQAASLQLLQVLFGVWAGSGSQVSHRYACELAEQLLPLAERLGGPSLLTMARFADLTSRIWRQPLAASVAQAEALVEACKPLDMGRCLAQFGENPSSNALGIQALALACAGEKQRARAAAIAAVAAAIAHPVASSQCFAYTFAAQTARRLGDVEQLEEWASAAAHLAEQHDLPLWRDAATCLLGWAVAARGDRSGIDQARHAWQGVQRALPSVEVSFAVAVLDACARCSAWDELLDEVDAVLATAERRDDRYLYAELLNLKARALIATRNGQGAAALLEQAIVSATVLGDAPQQEVAQVLLTALQ